MNIKYAVIIKSVIIGLVFTFLVMLLLSALMLWFNIGENFSAAFATLSVGVGSFAAAFYAARKIGSRGYLTGLIVGVTTFLLVLLLSLMVSKESLTFNTLFHLIIIVISSLVGGILGINFKRDKKYI